jgi:iron-sulfur cluster repair protein YtfE (RIC family)
VPPSEKSGSAQDVLSEDHEALDKLLSALVAAFDEGNAPTVYARLDLFWGRLAMHIRGENLHLFPAILGALQSGNRMDLDETPSLAQVREAIAQLHFDHDFFMHELAAAIKVMRDCRTIAGRDSTGQIESVRQVVATVRNRLETHNKLEEDLVYRWPAILLEPEEQVALGARIREELKNLPPRFRDEA